MYGTFDTSRHAKCVRRQSTTFTPASRELACAVIPHEMSGTSAESPEYLAETNDPSLDQRMSIVVGTFFLSVNIASRYYNPKAVGLPMLVCNTLCYVLCIGNAATGICKSVLSVF